MNKGCLKLIPQTDPEEPSSEPAFQSPASGREADALRDRVSQVPLSENGKKRDYLLNAVSEHTQIFVIPILCSLGLQIAHFNLTWFNFSYLNPGCCQNNLP